MSRTPARSSPEALLVLLQLRFNQVTAHHGHWLRGDPYAVSVDNG